MAVAIVGRGELRYDQAPPTRAWHIANELNKSGIPTTLIGKKSEVSEAITGDNIITVKYITESLIGRLLSRIQIPIVALQVLLTKKIDYVIVRGHDLVLMAIFIKLLGKKMIFDFHGYRYEEQIIEGRVARSLSTKIFEWFMLSCANYITAIKKELRDDIPQNLQKKTLLLPNGVNLEEFANSDVAENILTKYGIVANKKIIGFVGNWEAWVNIEEAIACAKYLEEDTAVLIVGEGRNLEKYKNENPSIIFTGRVPHKDAIKLLKKIYVCIYPYSAHPIMKKKSSRKTLEYLAAGKPIVASDVSGRDKFLKEGENVLLYRSGDPKDLAEKVKILLEDQELYAKLSNNNLKLSKEFSWSAVIERSGLLNILNLK